MSTVIPRSYVVFRALMGTAVLAIAAVGLLLVAPLVISLFGGS